MKIILTATRQVCEWVFREFNETFPSVRPAMAGFLEQTHEDIVKYHRETTREGSLFQKVLINEVRCKFQG